MRFLTPEEMRDRKEQQKKLMYGLFFITTVAVSIGITYLVYTF
ncbi:hypothetical protein [Rossellomorea sp. BNER]|jgi:hypothetical protein